MKIAIDGRLIEETGVGRYTKKLIEQLGAIDRHNRYVVFLRKRTFSNFKLPNERWEKRLAEVSWHSAREQLVMPWLLVKEHADLVHIPYHNIPIFYPGKYVVTMHDLTILHFDTGRATTLPLPLYKLRRLGYYIALAVGLRRATHVLAVSQFTKGELMAHFQLKPDQITVTYEGADVQIRNSCLAGRQAKFEIRKEGRLIKSPYFLYVGNAYPHKNLELLVGAFEQLIKTKPRQLADTKLVLVGKDDFFYQRLKQAIATTSVADRIVLFGPADEPTLAQLYRETLTLVFPSLMEGFGLPALEALVHGAPVVCADIPTFREILGELPLYFSASSQSELMAVLVKVVSDNASLRQRVEQAQLRLKRYQWKQMAVETLAVYQRVAGK